MEDEAEIEDGWSLLNGRKIVAASAFMFGYEDSVREV